MSPKLSELTTLTRVDGSAADAPGIDSGHHVADSALIYTAFVDPTFTVGPKVHGGSLQAIAVAAARQALADLTEGSTPAHDPVAIASDYLAAPDPAEVSVVVDVRKRGRTVTLLTVDIWQKGRLMVASTVTLAELVDGDPHHSAKTLLDDVPVEPGAEGIHIDTSPLGEVMHLGGALDLVLEPTTFPMLRGETGEPVVVGWARPKGADPDPDFAVIICDISPPVVMNLALFGWAPTVQLTTYLRRRPAPGWLRFAASSVEVGKGMFEEDHLVIDSTGAVVAQSRQLALIPAAPSKGDN